MVHGWRAPELSASGWADDWGRRTGARPAFTAVDQGLLTFSMSTPMSGIANSSSEWAES
jgi:hypothetical protein